MIEEQVIFLGRVQGVSFRRTVYLHAQKYRVTGFVKNLEDGNVEMIVQGMPADIEQLIQSIQNDHRPAQINQIKRNSRQSSKRYIDFQIIN